MRPSRFWRHVAWALCVWIGHASAQIGTPGQFAVSPSGGATYTVPIEVPPGVAGMEPKLALVYNSQAGSGILGMGWSLSGLSAIYRCPQTLAQDGHRGSINYDSNDRFCLDGQRLVPVAGTYGAAGVEYRTEIETFSQIVSYGTAGTGAGPTSFIVKTKSGLTMEYGNDGSFVAALGKSAARVWALNKISDTAGNYMSITYTRDPTAGQYYPQYIEYGMNNGLGTGRTGLVQILYESRTDATTAYAGGSLVRTNFRIQRINTYSNDVLVKTYLVNYDPASLLHSSIASIQETEPSGLAAPKPAISFAYGENHLAEFQWADTAPLYTPAAAFVDGIGHVADYVDLNGDGLPDYILARWTNGALQQQVYLNKYDGAQVSWIGAPEFNLDTHAFIDGEGKMGDYVDLNGDGLPDFVLSRYMSASSSMQQVTLINTNTSTGSRWVETPAYNLPTHSYIDGEGKVGNFVDLNGDGLPDFIMARLTPASGSIQFATSINTGTGWQPAPQFDLPSEAYIDGEGPVGEFIDLNGDGLPDFIESRLENTFVRRVYINTGNGWRLGPEYILPVPADIQFVGKIGEFVDLNGDGLPDFISASDAGGALVKNVYLNTGAGWQSAPEYYPNTAAYIGGVGNVADYVDLNGDGLPDFVVSRWTSSAQMQQTVLINTGTGWLPASAQYQIPFHTFVDGLGKVADFVDLDGDGKPDAVLSRWVAGGSLQAQTSLAVANTAQLRSVVPGTGRSITVTHQSLPQAFIAGLYANSPGVLSGYPYVFIAPPMQVVTDVGVSTSGADRHSIYSYGPGLADLTGRGFLGFYWVHAQDALTGNVARTYYKQEFPFTGQTWAIHQVTANGSPFSEVTNYFDGCKQYVGTTVTTTTNCAQGVGARFAPSQRASVQETWELGGSKMPIAVTNQTFDDYGNATIVGSVQVGPNWEALGFSQTTQNTYAAANLTNWILGRLLQSTVTNVTP